VVEKRRFISSSLKSIAECVSQRKKREKVEWIRDFPLDRFLEHARHIYKKNHAEEVAHKTAWAAVKNEYEKKGIWVKESK
jgi:ChaB